jgi:hypothetical protein
VLCEVKALEFRTELAMHVVAPEAEADDLADFLFGAATLTVGAFLPLLRERRVGLLKHRFCDTLLFFAFVIWASTKLDGAFAVVVSFHWQTTHAFAFFAAALPIMPGKTAIVSMAHVAPRNRSQKNCLVAGTSDIPFNERPVSATQRNTFVKIGLLDSVVEQRFVLVHWARRMPLLACNLLTSECHVARAKEAQGGLLPDHRFRLE